MVSFLESVVTSLIGAGGVAGIFAALSKAWFELQLEKFKREQNQQLEAIKADLTLMVRLRGSAEEKRAEVAARVLLSCLQYLDFLRVVTSPFRFGGEPGQDGFKKDVEARWRGAAETELDYSKSWALAETYLPAEIAGLMERIWKLRAEIWANQSTHFDLVAQGGHDSTFYQGGFGSSTVAEIVGLRDEAKVLLRATAQLEALPNKALNLTGLRPTG